MLNYLLFQRPQCLLYCGCFQSVNDTLAPCWVPEASYSARRGVVEGDIVTSPSVIEHENNCNHVQIEGEIINPRQLDWIEILSDFPEGPRYFFTDSQFVNRFFCVNEWYTDDPRGPYYYSDGEYLLEFFIGMTYEQLTVTLHRYNRKQDSIVYQLIHFYQDQEFSWSYQDVWSPIDWFKRKKERILSSCIRKADQTAWKHSLGSFRLGLNKSTTAEMPSYTKLDVSEYRLSIDFGENHYKAIKNIDAVTCNGIAYIEDIRRLKDTVLATYKLMQGDVNPKNLANLFLSAKYGYANMYRDTKEILESLVDMRNDRTYAYSQVETQWGLATMRTCIEYQRCDQNIMSLYWGLRDFDLLPSADNLWDLVPFSFVVNWFTPIGEFFSRLDAKDLLNHITIKKVIDSVKVEWDLPVNTGVYRGSTVRMSRYQRHISTDCAFPLCVTRKPSIQEHWLEGTALIVQRF